MARPRHFMLSSIVNRKFWEELIAQFPLIRHEPHIKKCLGGHKHTENKGITNASMIQHGQHRKQKYGGAETARQSHKLPNKIKENTQRRTATD